MLTEEERQELKRMMLKIQEGREAKLIEGKAEEVARKEDEG
jgi:hypothetical protein